MDDLWSLIIIFPRGSNNDPKFSERKYYSVRNPIYFFLISWIMVFSVEVNLFDGGFGVIDKVGD